MKSIYNISLCIFLLSSFLSCKSSDPLVKQKRIETIDAKLSQTQYTFEANNAAPMGGRIISLTSSYNVRVSPDTITAYLPYFGRAYSAPYPGTDGGIKFTSTDFDYTASGKEKGMYRISIDIKDSQERYKLSFLIGETGSATLYVSQVSKQSITFTGNID